MNNITQATTTDKWAHATTTGDWANASTAGDSAHATTTGDWANASTAGDSAHAYTAGYRAHAGTTGVGSHAFSADGAAESAHAVAVGQWVRLSETSCAAVVLPDNPAKHEPFIVSKNDGWAIGVWITMIDGVVKEMPDVLLPDDGRGYRLTVVNGRYIAGCRNFDYAVAVAHWSDPHHPVPRSAARLSAEVQRHHNALEGSPEA
jgi:hypothetical protein